MGKFVIPSRGNCGKGCVALNPPPGRSQGKHLLWGCCRDFWLLWETKDMLFLQKEEDWELREVGCVLWRGVGCGRRSQGSYPSKCWQTYSMEAVGWERMQAAVCHHCMLLWCLFLQFSTRTKTFAGSCLKPMVTNLSSSLLLCHFSPLLLFCLRNSKTKLNINKQYLTDVVLVATSICRVCPSPPPAYICYFDGLFTAVAAHFALGVELWQWLVLNDFNIKIIKLTKC